MQLATAAVDVRMPRLSDSMEEGTIVKWLVADGEHVTVGQDLVEVETDKATVTYEAEAEGRLTILVPAGDTVALGHPIARLGDGPAAPDVEDAAADGGAGSFSSSEPTSPPAAPPPSAATAEPSAQSTARVKATPVARRMASEHALVLTGVAGSGPNGRIVKKDIEALVRQVDSSRVAPSEAPAPTPAIPIDDATPAPVESDAPIVQPLSRVQQTIARRMAESKSTVPDFAVSIDVDMEAAIALRAQLKQATPEGRSAPSFNDMIVKAAALALREFPRANGSYGDGSFELHERINVGVAVAAEDALLVPTVVDADRKSLGEIARTTRALAEKARTGKLTPPELSGGTFTVSNLGMYGIARFQAIVNPPQAAILAVGAITEQPAVHESQIVPRHRMTMTLTADHRILYGADAAAFLARVRDLLESPLALAF